MELSTEQSIAKKLLEIGAIFLKPNPEEFFTWASGIRSPIYCDNRMVLSNPSVRDFIISAFVDLIRKNFPTVELIAGVATAGIAHSALIADRLNLPMIYIRSSAKEHGRSNLIEGSLKPGQKTVIIEDLISTGGSSIKAALSARSAGADVLGLVSIFTYELASAQENFAKAQIPFYSLSNYTKLLELALSDGLINQEQLSILQNWRDAFKNPSA